MSSATFAAAAKYPVIIFDPATVDAESDGENARGFSSPSSDNSSSSVFCLVFGTYTSPRALLCVFSSSRPVVCRVSASVGVPVVPTPSPETSIVSLAFAFAWFLFSSRLTARTPARVTHIPRVTATETPSPSACFANPSAMNGFKMSMRITLRAPMTRKLYSHRLSPNEMPMNAESTSHAATSGVASDNQSPRRDAIPATTNPIVPTQHLTRFSANASPVHVLFQMNNPIAPSRGVAAAASTPTVSVGMPAVVPETMAKDAPSDEKASGGAGTSGDAPTDARTRAGRPRGHRERRARARSGAGGQRESALPTARITYLVPAP